VVQLTSRVGEYQLLLFGLVRVEVPDAIDPDFSKERLFIFTLAGHQIALLILRFP